MQPQTLRRVDGGERRLHIAGKAEIVHVQMQRMAYAGRVHGALHALENLARGEAVFRHNVVEREGPDILLEGVHAAGVHAFDADGARRLQRRADIVLHDVEALIVAERGQHERLVAEHGQERLVDDRNVRQFEMGVQRVMRRHGRLDHRGVAHLRIEPAGLEGRPARRRQRRRGGARLMSAMRLGQQQPRGVHAAAGDMGMDVDGAGHDDMAGKVMRHVGLAPVRARDDAAVLEINVANGVGPVDGIDHMAAGKAGQHGTSSENLALMASMTWATLGASLGALARRSTNELVSCASSTASCVSPGRPTSM